MSKGDSTTSEGASTRRALASAGCIVFTILLIGGVTYHPNLWTNMGQVQHGAGVQAVNQQLEQVQAVNQQLEQLANMLQQDQDALDRSLAPLDGFPGLTAGSMEALRNQRIVTLGDSTMNYWVLYGMFPLMNLMQHVPDFDFSAPDATLAAVDKVVHEKKLMNITGTIWDRRVELPYWNTNITHYSRAMCDHFGDELIQTIMDEKPTIFIFNLGLHLMHLLDPKGLADGRDPEPCAIDLWNNYSGWLDFILEGTSDVPVRIFKTTNTVGDEDFQGAWLTDAKLYRDKDPATLKVCEERFHDRGYCEDMCMISESADKLNFGAIQSLAKHDGHDIYVLPYHTLTNNLTGKGTQYHYDGRHHRPDYGGALTFTRFRMLIELLNLLPKRAVSK